MSAPCRSSAATSSRSPAEQAAINTAPWANRTFARRVPEPLEISRDSEPVWSVSEPSHRCSWSCRRCLAASDREWSVAAIFPGLSRTDSAHGTRREAECRVWIPHPRPQHTSRTAPPGGQHDIANFCDWVAVLRCLQELLGSFPVIFFFYHNLWICMEKFRQLRWPTTQSKK